MTRYRHPMMKINKWVLVSIGLFSLWNSSAHAIEISAPSPTPSNPVFIPTDSNIGSVVLTKNSTEASLGRIALYRYYSHNELIHSYAVDVRKSCEEWNQKLAELLTRNQIRPTPSDWTVQMMNATRASVASFIQLSPTAFYKAYINNEVIVQQDFLNKLQNVLLPGASTAELISYLQNLITLVQAQLIRAQEIATHFDQSGLSK